MAATDVAKSGQMDGLTSRVASILVRNEPGAELLEATWSVPEILVYAPGVASICGLAVPVSRRYYRSYVD